MYSRRDILHGIFIVPFAGILKLPEFEKDEFEEFDQRVGGTPYISGIVNEPPEKINGISYPGRLRITCTMKHDDDCVILEHTTWEYLYPNGKEEEMELGLKGYMASEKWFAKKLYDEAHKPLQALQHVPEFQWDFNPVKLKLSCIECCCIDKESGRLILG